MSSHRSVGLGDPHNFGRQVRRRGRYIEKPRTVFWERCFLDPWSPLRKILLRINSGHSGLVADFLPAISYRPQSKSSSGAYARTEDLRHKLRPLRALPRWERAYLLRMSGQLLAFAQFFGWTDLHSENIAVGREKGGRMVFGPMDLEAVFESQIFPIRTMLLPTTTSHGRATFGLGRILPILGSISPADLLIMAVAFHQQWGLLFENQARILRTLQKMIREDHQAPQDRSKPRIHSIPIRFLIRPTRDYRSHEADLLDEELEQLARGDIPYFFRFLDQPSKLFYFAERSMTHPKPVKLPAALRKHVKSTTLFSLRRGWSKRDSNLARFVGTSLLISTFEKSSWLGSIRAHGHALELSPKGFRLEIRGEKPILGRRFQTDYVSPIQELNTKPFTKRSTKN